MSAAREKVSKRYMQTAIAHYMQTAIQLSPPSWQSAPGRVLVISGCIMGSSAFHLRLEGFFFNVGFTSLAKPPWEPYSHRSRAPCAAFESRPVAGKRRSWR